MEGGGWRVEGGVEGEWRWVEGGGWGVYINVG